MKILHTIQGLGISGGGPSHSVFYTVKGLRDLGNKEVHILAFSPNEGDKSIANEDFIIEIPREGSLCKSFSLYKKRLSDISSDIYHSQGVWSYITYLTSCIARKKNKPYIITPRGMLYPQALAKSRLKKKIFLSLTLFRDMKKATCIQATCMEEMMHIRNLGITTPVAVIPNPIEIPDLTRKEHKIRKRIGYLGRVHPRKNIERLLSVFRSLQKDFREIDLFIIGDGDNNYMSFLKDEVKRLNVENVYFTGFLSGKEKEDAINNLDYLVVPSNFENFGMIVAEALTYKVPVIASKGTPWEDLINHNCGWWVENDVDSLTNSLRVALSISEEERVHMGENGRRLMIEKYSSIVIAHKMNQLYSWILEGGDKPEFVYL